MKYLVTQQYEVDVPDEVLEANREFYQKEWHTEGVTDAQVIVAMVEEFHVGNFTDRITQVNNTVATEDQENEVL
jgi:hypothetical protein